MRRVDKWIFNRELRQLKRSKNYLLKQASEPCTDPYLGEAATGAPDIELGYKHFNAVFEEVNMATY